MAKGYEVGYQKPPKEKQFVKGRSGNSKGRPKGSKNITTLFREVANKTIQVTENGKTTTMTRKQAVVLRLTNMALSGQLQSMKEFIYLIRLAEETSTADQQPVEPSERDAVLMKSIVERMSKMTPALEEAQECVNPVRNPSVHLEANE